MINVNSTIHNNPLPWLKESNEVSNDKSLNKNKLCNLQINIDPRSSLTDAKVLNEHIKGVKV